MLKFFSPFYTVTSMVFAPLTLCKGSLVEVFFESPANRIHWPDLRATFDHHAFLQVTLSIKPNPTSGERGKPHFAASSAPGYTIITMKKHDQKGTKASYPAADTIKVFSRFQHTVSGTASLSRAGSSECTGENGSDFIA